MKQHSQALDTACDAFQAGPLICAWIPGEPVRVACMSHRILPIPFSSMSFCVKCYQHFTCFFIYSASNWNHQEDERESKPWQIDE